MKFLGQFKLDRVLTVAHLRVIENLSGKSPGAPSMHCDWTPNESGTGIVWNGEEGFFTYREWLEYIISRHLQPWGYTLNGTVEWTSCETDERGAIQVVNNNVNELAPKETHQIIEIIKRRIFTAQDVAQRFDSLAIVAGDSTPEGKEYLTTYLAKTAIHEELTELLKEIQGEA